MMRSKFYLFIKFGYSWLPKSNYILWVYKELLSEYIQFIIMKDLYAIRIAKLKSAITTRALTIIKIKAWLSFSILLWSPISWLKNFLLQEIFFSFLLQIRNIFPKCFANINPCFFIQSWIAKLSSSSYSN